MTNNTSTPTTTPEGFTTVSPYLVVNNVEAQTKFLQTVFNAIVKDTYNNPDGTIMHTTLFIGNTTLMIGQTNENFPSNTPTTNYVFVNTVDSVFETALAEGAFPISEPTDKFYGNREGGFKDPEGNIWWVAQVIHTATKEVIENFAPQSN